MFAVFSLACAVSQTMLQLMYVLLDIFNATDFARTDTHTPTLDSIFRAFKGLAGGGLFTMVMIVMADLLSLKDRGKFQGMIEGVIAIRYIPSLI